MDKKISLNASALRRYQGCLIGGAIGDALGWPIEFRRLSEIRARYGDNGIQDLVINDSGKAEITDDTQMTMFTADGLIKALRKNLNPDIMPDMHIIFDSYKLWLNTQCTNTIQKGKGWIAELKDLYVTRAPGMTCISAIRNGIPGSIKVTINDSAGCGGVMRVAPAGLIYKNNPELAFNVGVECAALTHSNPRAYLPAGVLSEIIAHLVNGKDVEEALNLSLKTLEKYEGYEPVANILQKAQTLTKPDIPADDAIKFLGEGWVGDEAIAIAVYCALKEPENFEEAIRMAVNHNGDSDSTGAILGNILGAHLGLGAIPEKWIEATELSNELSILAKDLFVNPKDIEYADIRYPTSKD